MKSTVIFGNPGTGKTYDLVERLKKFKQQGYSARDIHVLSHTRAAAKEIADRSDGANANTIHSLAYRYCGMIKEQVISSKDLMDFSEKIGVPMKGALGDNTLGLEAGDEYMAMINYAMNQMISVEDYAREYTPVTGNTEEFIYFHKSYLNYKEAYGYVDFNDMLKKALDLHPVPTFSVLCVDEAQDLSPLQWALIDRLIATGKISEIVVTGDPDQSLFIWGGADVHGMEKFAEKYSSDIRELVQSYRVPQDIHSLSETIIRKSTNRYAKKYLPTKEKGSVISVSNATQCNWPIMNGQDTLVLYRTHVMRNEIEEELIRYNLPYVTLNGYPSLYSTGKANAIRTWCKICEGMEVDKKELQVLERHSTGTSAPIIKARNFNALRNMKREEVVILPTWHYEYYRDTDFTQKATIKLSTIHGAKGREADYVFLFDGVTQRILDNMTKDPDEELKVWFVAVTRAKKKLVWVNSMEFQSIDL